ncbi:hypothetical protein N6H18_02175 [Reichenbachiella agarivorans]|uniref:DUF4304 domain-containing protein n=1 Tax=Reichenbachiella agarivorans TaxID=2979464 RepID=A0ABY6CTI0_9BACT|nr:hypothetical protein [Reichenbachiella agarivorans]UXP32768.1 hypothetical protein N6H18_02175 [Reichenbachiella agarivorans]
MNKTERKSVFFGVLTPYLVGKGYTPFLSGGDPTYVLNTNNNLVVHFFFNFYSSGMIGVAPMFLTHYDIEDYILRIGIPTNDLIQSKKKEKYHLPTIKFSDLPDSLNERILETQKEAEDFATSYISYIENEGKAFIERYSFLPNVLAEMDRLESEGEDWNGILSGMGDRLFRGVIISKLCNDPNFQKKMNYCEMKFTTVQLLEEWQPYWSKLKEVLPSIKPKYNL